MCGLGSMYPACERNYHVHRISHQLRCQRRESIEVTIGGAMFDGKIRPLTELCLEFDCKDRCARGERRQQHSRDNQIISAWGLFAVKAYLGHNASLASHLDRGINGVFEIVRVVVPFPSRKFTRKLPVRRRRW